MSTLSDYSQHLSGLIPALGKEDFPQRLVQMLQALVPCEDATILLYPGTDLPVIEYFEMPEESGPSTLDIFIRGPFLLDPYYLAATHDKRFGVFRLCDLSPTGFRESEYYRSWYRNCGYQDECGYLIAIGEEGFVNIALGRTKPRARFSQNQRAIFEAILPAVETLCRQHWADSSAPTTAVNLRAKLHSALDAFGSSLLTERETQVINLVLHGHSTKTLAERLSISMETVKLHRKHAYAKLEVSSQAELFYLFLDSVMSAGDHGCGDPLVSYMQPPHA